MVAASTYLETSGRDIYIRLHNTRASTNMRAHGLCGLGRHTSGVYIPGGGVSRHVYPATRRPGHLQSCGHRASAVLVGISRTSVFFTQYIDVPLPHHFPGSLSHDGIRQRRSIRPRCRCGHDLTLYGRPFMFCVLYARITCHIQHTDTDLAHDRMHLVECRTKPRKQAVKAAKAVKVAKVKKNGMKKEKMIVMKK